MIAAVTGATGCVGYALCRYLLADERFSEVRTLVRSAAADLPPSCRAFAGTLGDAEVLRALCAGADVVFHAAAQVHTPLASTADFERVNICGTEALLAAATAGGVSRLVYFGTVAVYGESTPPGGIGEDAPPAPATAYARSKLRGEALVSEWAARTGNAAVLLRLATVYGARDRGNMARMIGALRRGRFVLPSGGANRKTVVGVDNAARIAVVAATHPGVPSGVPVVVADPDGVVTLRDLAAAMADAAGVPRGRATRSAPTALLLLAADVLERLRPGAAPITRVQVERLAADNIYRAERFRSFAGDAPFVSLGEGLARAASELLNPPAKI